MENKKTKLIIGILVLIILILGVIVVYTYVAKPLVTGYVDKNYNQGASDVLGVLVNQIQTQGYAQIPVGNQTLVLVPYIPPQLSQENLQNNFEE
tara:strand:- start:2463 stop:2744 length:282 start_codon:yes stop_codon:yes gene_type:complete